MEGVKEGMPKIAELKLEEVKENETEVKPEEHLAVPPPAAKEKLQFKDMPLDMKRLVFSYVRKFLHVLFLSICWLCFLGCLLCLFVDHYVPLPRCLRTTVLS